MALPTFWAICEAVVQGDAHAAEFADMTVEDYASHGIKCDGDVEVLAAQKIQAAQRGRLARLEVQKVALEDAAALIQASYLGRVVRHSAWVQCAGL